jgi:hypothetical protein
MPRSASLQAVCDHSPASDRPATRLLVVGEERAHVAGYSRKPITEKIGARVGHRIYVDGAPDDLELSWPSGVTVLRRLPTRPVDIAWCFCPDRARLEKRVDLLASRIVVNGALWISWPKKSGGMFTDLDEAVVRERGLLTGLVDVLVAAVDDTWSGLKFVRRLRDR